MGKFNITEWVLALVSPVVGRVLTALGLGLASVAGFTMSIEYVKNMLVNSVNTLPADMLNLALIAGVGQGLGIITGAITTKLLLIQADRSVKLVTTNRG